MIQFESVAELLATAQQIEIGAAERYSEYADIAETNSPEVAALFRRLAEEEKQHEKSIVGFAEKASIDLSKSTPSQSMPTGKIDDVSQVNGTQYEILAAAVRREELAFEIYSKIAASSEDEDLRHYAEILAKEELGHAALLRAIRRRVYSEHKSQTKSLPGPDKINSIGEFLFNAYILENALASYIDELNGSGVDTASSKAHSNSVIQQLRIDIEMESNISDQEVNDLVPLSDPRALFNMTTFTLDNLLNVHDFIYDYYDNFVSKTDNEEIMNKALLLASQTLMQLALLQKIKNHINND